VIALTLLRAVGDLSRGDLVTRPSGHAGPALKTPGAQCLGRHRFRFAIAPRAAAPGAGSLFAASREFVLRPRIAAAANPHARGPLQTSFVEALTERGSAVLSALKKADHRNSVVVRLFNPEREPGRVRLRLAGGVGEAFGLDLLEERREALPVGNEGANIALGPAQIRTVELGIPPACRPSPAAPRPSN